MSADGAMHDMVECCCVQADATALDFDALDAEEGPFTIAVSFLTSGAACMPSDYIR